MDLKKLEAILGRYGTRLIRHKVRELITQLGLRPYEAEDLEHDLILNLLKKLPKYNHTSKWNHFLRLLVDRKTATMVDSVYAQKRSISFPKVSLQSMVSDGMGRQVPLSEVTEGQASDEDAVDLAIDMKRFIRTLPPHLRKLCQVLKYHRLSNYAKKCATPRTNYYWHIEVLRRLMRQQGLHRYLE